MAKMVWGWRRGCDDLFRDNFDINLHFFSDHYAKDKVYLDLSTYS
jgi:hypothetical protein